MSGNIFMLGIFTTSQSLFKKINSCHRTPHGIKSDHDATCIELHLNSIPFKSNKIETGQIDWDTIAHSPIANASFNNFLFDNTEFDNNYTSFHNQILPAAKRSATKLKTKNKGWF